MTQEQTTTNGLRVNIDNLQAYPLLTENDGAARTAPAAGVAMRSDIGQTVEGTLRALLAWRPKTDDPKGFLAALNQAFEITDVDGHTEWRWNPRTYAIQADMGAVTGAQASIHARASAALDQSLPLLEGLYPLLSTADPQDVEAVRAMVRNALTELVEELGTVGGPRLQRIDSYFLSLLGPLSLAIQGSRQANPEQLVNPELVGGLLGLMRERFGLKRSQVNTIDEEQNLTNYLILVDHTIALQRSWVTYRHFFDRDGIDVFLGTQLVLLSRALNVIAESVYEVEAAMDSVYLDAAERQITRLPLERNQFQLTIAELLGWAYAVASDEGLRLINDAGKDGVITLAPILEQLHQLVEEALELSLRDGVKLLQSNSLVAVPPFHTPRVRVVLKGLERSLFEAVRLAKQLRRQPDTALFAVQPNHARQGDVVRISIEGEALPERPRVHLNRAGPSNERIDGDHVTNVRLISPHEIRATLDLSSAAPGLWTVVVTGPDDVAYALHDAFTIEDAPPEQIAKLRLKAIDPQLGFAGQHITVNISGEGFRQDLTDCFFGPGTTAHTAVLSSSHLQVDLRIDRRAPSGPRDVRVTVGTKEAILPHGFTVYELPSAGPNLTALEPNEEDAGKTNVAVEVHGSGFSNDAKLTIGDGSKVRVLLFTKLKRQWFAILDIAPSAAGAYDVHYDVVVRNGDGKEDRLIKGFTVRGHPYGRGGTIVDTNIDTTVETNVETPVEPALDTTVATNVETPVEPALDTTVATNVETPVEPALDTTVATALQRVELINAQAPSPLKAKLLPPDFMPDVKPSRAKDGVETVRLVFNTAMRTVAATLALRRDQGLVLPVSMSGPIKINGDSADLTASANLAPGSYELVVQAAGTTDTNGRALPSDLSIRFTISV